MVNCKTQLANDFTSSSLSWDDSLVFGLGVEENRKSQQRT